MSLAYVRAGTDAWVDSASPSKNNGIGRYTRVLNPGTSTQYGYLHVKLPTPVLKGATVLSATLKLYEATGEPGGSRTVSVQRLADKWGESKVNWNNRPPGTGGSVSLTQTATDDSEWAFDVTGQVQAMSDGAPNYGWRISTTSTKQLKFWSFDAGQRRPVLEVEWSDAPDAPSELSPAGGSAVTLAKPVLSLNFHDVSGSTKMGALQVQVNDTNSFTSPAFDSGWVTTTDPELDLSTTTYAGISVGATQWWRARVRDAAGVVSGWSSAVSFTRTARGTLTITSPTGGVINDPTQEITWALTGATQTGWSVYVWDMDANDPSKPIHGTGRRAGTEQAYTLPKGVITQENRNYRVRVRVWDVPTRTATPGDPTHTEAIQDFVFGEDGTVLPITLLQAEQLKGSQPPVRLTWHRSAEPDAWSIWDNGTLLAHDVELVPDASGTYRWTDYKAAPRVVHKYTVRAKNNGKLGTGKTIEYSFILPDVWLCDTNEGHLVPVNAQAGGDIITWSAPEAGSSVQVKNKGHVVRIYQSQMGLQGTIQGVLIDGHGGTATTWLANLEWMQARPKQKMRLIVGRMSFNVVLSEIVIAPYPYGDNPDESIVSMSFWAQSEDW